MMVAGQPHTRLKVRSQNDKGFVGLWYLGTAMGEPSGRGSSGLVGCSQPPGGARRDAGPTGHPITWGKPALSPVCARRCVFLWHC